MVVNPREMTGEEVARLKSEKPFQEADLDKAIQTGGLPQVFRWPGIWWPHANARFHHRARCAVQNSGIPVVGEIRFVERKGTQRDGEALSAVTAIAVGVVKPAQSPLLNQTFRHEAHVKEYARDDDVAEVAPTRLPKAQELQDFNNTHLHISDLICQNMTQGGPAVSFPSWNRT